MNDWQLQSSYQAETPGQAALGREFTGENRARPCLDIVADSGRTAPGVTVRAARSDVVVSWAIDATITHRYRMMLSKNVSRIDVYETEGETLVATLQIVTRWGKRRGILTVHRPQFDAVAREVLMEPTTIMSGGRHGDTFVDALRTLIPFSDEAIAHALEYGLRDHGLRGVRHSS